MAHHESGLIPPFYSALRHALKKLLTKSVRTYDQICGSSFAWTMAMCVYKKQSLLSSTMIAGHTKKNDQAFSCLRAGSNT